MLDHVETVFEEMKPMMKKLKKKTYETNMEEFLEKHGHYFYEMTDHVGNVDDKSAAADELARTFTEKVEKAYISPKKGRIEPVVQLDLNFFMIYYIFPAILKTEHEDARLVADHLRDEWNRRFKDSNIQYTDYDSLYASFREKIFGIF